MNQRFNKKLSQAQLSAFTSTRFFLLFGLLFYLPSLSSAQWVAYTFSPRIAWQSSYGMTTNTTNSTTALLANGWPSSWSNSALRGVVALYFSTNTNSLNSMVMLPPLVYTFTTNTNAGVLTTNNYTNLSVLSFTNTNTSGTNSANDPLSFVSTVKNGPATWMVGQLSFLSTDASNNPLTNVLGSFNNLCTPYTTNQIGTNGVLAGTNFLPFTLALKLSTLSRATSTVPFTNSQQLILPLTLNATLTKLINTNTNFGPLILTSPLTPFTSNPLYTNLPRLIRSNGTFTNF